jgi:hypothetical protein
VWSVHRCVEQHPFNVPEKEAPCNGCGAVVEDRELVKYRDAGYPYLVMDCLVRERSITKGARHEQ